MKKLVTVLGLSAMLLAFNVVAVSQDSKSDAVPVFARINDLTISQSEFEVIFQAAVRQKFYHGKVPASELKEFRKKVTDDIVTQVLVHDQALELGLQPDRKKIDEGIDAFNLRNAANPDWEQRRDKIVPRMIEKLERQDLLEQMEARIRDLPAPAPAEVRRYYHEQPEKFTEPERLRVSGILLQVAPAAGEKIWIETEQQADGYYQRILAGEDFAELAKQYSHHPSAVNGGDLGYLHQGMLDDKVQQQLETLSPGQTGEPLRVLEGIALFRLENIQPTQLRPFEEVKERAAELLYREMQDHAWQAYVNTLRSSANVYVNQ
jgi:parvulin-like peptidyl-prolyl isomerase